MPYGLPEHLNTPANNAKIERCVNDRLADAKFEPKKGRTKKQAAIAICKASIMGTTKRHSKKFNSKVFRFFTSSKVKEFSDKTKTKIIKNVEILRTGTWNGNTFKEKDLQWIVDNFNSLKESDVYPNVPVRSFHPETWREGSESIIGYVVNLFKKGTSLFADMEITEPDGYEKIKRGTWRERSVEIGEFFSESLKKLFAPILSGVAWVDKAAVEGMSSSFEMSKKKDKKKYKIINLNKEEIMKVKKKSKMKKKEGKKKSKIELAKMTRKAINDLPDSAFAYVESGGKKDESGKTVPRSLRHYPIHDAAHVRNALARIGQGKRFGKEALGRVCGAAGKFNIESDLCKSRGKMKKKEGKKKILRKKSKTITLSLKDFKEMKGNIKTMERQLRVKELDVYSREGKILPANFESYKKLVSSLSDKQMEAFREIMNRQAPVVQFKKEHGVKTGTQKKVPKKSEGGRLSGKDKDKIADKIFERTSLETRYPEKKKGKK